MGRKTADMALTILIGERGCPGQLNAKMKRSHRRWRCSTFNLYGSSCNATTGVSNEADMAVARVIYHDEPSQCGSKHA